MYRGVEISKNVEDIMNAIRNLDSKNLGMFLDDLYLKLKGDRKEYQFLLDFATNELEQNLSDIEIEEQDNKLENSKSDVVRWRSSHELSLDEYFAQTE